MRVARRASREESARDAPADEVVVAREQRVRDAARGDGQHDDGLDGEGAAHRLGARGDREALPHPHAVLVADELPVRVGALGVAQRELGRLPREPRRRAAAERARDRREQREGARHDNVKNIRQGDLKNQHVYNGPGVTFVRGPHLQKF